MKLDLSPVYKESPEKTQAREHLENFWKLYLRNPDDGTRSLVTVSGMRVRSVASPKFLDGLVALERNSQKEHRCYSISADFVTFDTPGRGTPFNPQNLKKDEAKQNKALLIVYFDGFPMIFPIKTIPENQWTGSGQVAEVLIGSPYFHDFRLGVDPQGDVDAVHPGTGETAMQSLLKLIADEYRYYHCD